MEGSSWVRDEANVEAWERITSSDCFRRLFKWAMSWEVPDKAWISVTSESTEFTFEFIVLFCFDDWDFGSEINWCCDYLCTSIRGFLSFGLTRFSLGLFVPGFSNPMGFTTNRPRHHIFSKSNIHQSASLNGENQKIKKLTQSALLHVPLCYYSSC